ncbi:hypothetical protein NBRC116494_08870 [Aurantivibrio plasticivorans]
MSISSPRNLSDSDIASLLKTLSEDRLVVAKRHKAEGKKVIGYISNNVPLELIDAAGILPVHLAGIPGESTPLADRFLEPAFDPWSRSIFNRLLRGDYDFLDAIVLPRTHDSFQRLYYYLCEIERSHPEFSLPPIYLLNLLHTDRKSTRNYNRAQFDDFKAYLSTIGSEITNQRLSTSIERYNQLRIQLKYFSDLRADRTRFFSNTLCYQTYAASQSFPVNTAIDVALYACEQFSEKPDKERFLRLIVAGNGLDYPLLHTVLDRHNCLLVGEYHSLGNHFLDTPLINIDDNSDLTDKLVDHYQLHTISGRSFDSSANNLLDFSHSQQADAVLFHYLLKEEALAWHYPAQQRAIVDSGLSTELMIDQPYQLDVDALTQAIASLKSKIGG